MGPRAAYGVADRRRRSRQWVSSFNIMAEDGRYLRRFFQSGDEVTVEASDEGIQFLLVSGNHFGKPVA